MWIPWLATYELCTSINTNKLCMMPWSLMMNSVSDDKWSPWSPWSIALMNTLFKIADKTLEPFMEKMCQSAFWMRKMGQAASNHTKWCPAKNEPYWWRNKFGALMRYMLPEQLGMKLEFLFLTAPVRLFCTSLTLQCITLHHALDTWHISREHLNLSITATQGEVQTMSYNKINVSHLVQKFCRDALLQIEPDYSLLTLVTSVASIAALYNLNTPLIVHKWAVRAKKACALGLICVVWNV